MTSNTRLAPDASTAPRPSSRRERNRRYAARRKLGTIVALVEVYPADIEVLVERGFLARGAATDRALIAEAVGQALGEALGTNIDASPEY
jgi:hypothetical protein